MSSLLNLLTYVLILLSSLSSFYLYDYASLHDCSFPSTDPAWDNPTSKWSKLSRRAGDATPPPHLLPPFRLLALGDPQLEGDSSLPSYSNGHFPSVATLMEAVASTEPLFEKAKLLRELPQKGLYDLYRLFYTARKRLDLLGNDYYLAHIYWSVHKHSNPTHVTVLGDLIGSQWIDDEEFEDRGRRFWKRVFRGGIRVKDEIMGEPSIETLGADKQWKKRIINVVGNHDVGYAGDMTRERIDRFERVFGKVNWEITFDLPSITSSKQNSSTSEGDDEPASVSPSLRIIVLNSLNLDTPATSSELQSETYDFVNSAISRSKLVEDRSVGTILLTHVPLHKENGVCVDSPFFDFHSQEKGGGLKEQNMISYNAGKGILEGLYGMSGNPYAAYGGLGRHGVILTGHDHEGCDIYHHLPLEEDIEARRWNVSRWCNEKEKIVAPIPGIREITVRSMMGDFQGNAGFLSAWFDPESNEWHFEYASCMLGVQHIWWAVHVLILVTSGVSAFTLLRHWLVDGSPKTNTAKSKEN
ncbi:hypothetical protein MMC25_003024 [Agyrium rufum]|nr:hypothetical protein [Agyrium rufum]